jgi:hypothetical protein
MNHLNHLINSRAGALFAAGLGVGLLLGGASQKPFLRPQVPNAASVSILNFDPNATWPP